ncbi:MAG: PspC domain-containing protein [Chitinophagaceae bacterium]
MNTIHTINYQGRTFQIEEDAYKAFQEYEKSLEEHFKQQADGEEILNDLKGRMSEILEQKHKDGVIHLASIEELIATIGKPNDFDEATTHTTQDDTKSKTTFNTDKKLYRDRKNKIIAGVCSGIANYFSIDPIAVRLLFVLFTVFNIISLFSFNVGVLGYIVLWIVLTPKHLSANISKQLFRNPKDKVLGGVCSGLAQFFNTEVWIVRIIFIAPLLIGFFSNHNHFMNVKFLGSSFASISFLSYFILWFIIPLAKSGTDYMLLKGEPINLKTIQKKTSMSTVTSDSNAGLNKFLKIIAYLIIGAFIIVLIPFLFGLGFSSFMMYDIADVILFSSFNKTLALLGLIFTVVLFGVAFLIWMFRRILNIKKQSKPLRITVASLFTLGILSLLFLVASLVSRMNTFYKVESAKNYIPIQSDTLIVDASQNSQEDVEQLFLEFNQSKNILEKGKDINKIKAFRFKTKFTDDDNFYYVEEKSALGANRSIAKNNAQEILLENHLSNNTFYINPIVAWKSNKPYNGQNAKITLYIPKNKTLIIKRNLRKQLIHNLQMGKNGFNINIKDGRNMDGKVISHYDDNIDDIEIVVDHDVDTKKEAIEEAQQNLKDAKEQLREAQQQLKENLRDLKRSKKVNKVRIQVDTTDY